MNMVSRSSALSILALGFIFVLSGCGSSYKAQPVSFRLPEQYPNATTLAGASVAARAFADKKQASEAFGFDVIDAGLLPVQVVFDNRGTSVLTINPSQTFLEDAEGNLWPVLQEGFAYERVTKYAQTKKIFKEGSYGGFLGGVAGAIVGAAVGVVSGEDIGQTTLKGAAAGTAAGAVLGGSSGSVSADEAKRRVMGDFEDKSLENKPVKPGDIAYGFIFFPGEAASARSLRLQLIDDRSDRPVTAVFGL